MVKYIFGQDMAQEEIPRVIHHSDVILTKVIDNRHNWTASKLVLHKTGS